jgi:uncharacterized protein
MASVTTRKTPGVYIEEQDAFPPSIVGVATAIPAFIGYTEKAAIGKMPVFNKPMKIGSMVDFEAIFGKNYQEGSYAIEEATTSDIADGSYDFSLTMWTENPAGSNNWDNPTVKYYKLGPANATFNLYSSMRLFYANGGGTCYVVSVGPYVDPASNTPSAIKLANLQAGLTAIRDQKGPTMLVIPDAVLLPLDASETNDQIVLCPDFNTLSTNMLSQCQALQDRVAILDVYGTDRIGTTIKIGNNDTQITIDTVIDAFRSGVNANLNYGMAYFPFPVTTVLTTDDFDFTSLDPIQGSGVDLVKILSSAAVNSYGEDVPNKPDTRTLSARGGAVLDQIKLMDTVAKSNDKAAIALLNQTLTAVLPFLNDIFKVLVAQNSILPPSAGLAGVVTNVDSNQGVWNAPANVSLNAVTRSSYALDNDLQADLNVPIDGKAINALRDFPTRGTVVWGARTLDGNSNDWRYIQVRRTIIYIEQSIKAALDRFVFAANEANTWVTVTAMVTAFLTQLWSQGGLMGAKASEAFTVQCGLGSTMTAQDILEGYMIVQITVQLIRPAEFIVLTFKQKMEGMS